MDGTDADGEWSDEEVIRSGSQTGVSDQEDSNNNSRVKTKPPPHHVTTSPHPPLITINGMTTGRVGQPSLASMPNPVTMILDRIDAQLQALDIPDTMLASTLSQSADRQGKTSRPGSSGSRTSLFGRTDQVLNGSEDTGLGSATFRESDVSDAEKFQKISGTVEIHSEAAMTDGVTDDERNRKLDSDIPSDLDSVAAQQIDLKFKEIMRKKKEDDETRPTSNRRLTRRNSTGSDKRKSRRSVRIVEPNELKRKDRKMPPDLPTHPGKPLGSLATRLRTRSATRPSATMLSTGCGTDNESVKTEEFETKFNSMIIQGSDTERKETAPKVVAPKVKTPSMTDISSKTKVPTETPGLSPQDEELLQRLVRIAETTSKAKTSSTPPPILNRPRSLSPTRMSKPCSEQRSYSLPDENSSALNMGTPDIIRVGTERVKANRNSLQRHRTADNLRFGFDSGPSPLNKRSSQIFSWDDDFWKTPTRRGPQSVASSASTFEEVESLCLSKSSSDSMSSSQRQWDRLCSGNWERRGLWNTPSSSRRFISRQSSTTSTSTSRSSSMIPDGQGDQASEHSQSHRPSITDTLLESMELLGAHGNLDLADKLYLEKIFHRVLDWNNGMPVSSVTSSSVMDSQLRDQAQSQPVGQNLRSDERSSNSPLSHARYRENQDKLEHLKQGGQKSRSPTDRPSQPVPLQQNMNMEKKRRRDLIIPEEEKNTSISHKHYKPASANTSINKRGNVERVNSTTQRDTFTSKRDMIADASSKYSYLSSVSSLSLDNGSLRGSPVQNLTSHGSHPNLATYLPNRAYKHGGSFESTASPPDPYMFSQPFTSSHAERVLMGLGFGATEGFLPERFLRDWYNKISRAQIESYLVATSDLREKENYETQSVAFQNASVGDTVHDRNMSESSQRYHLNKKNPNPNSVPSVSGEPVSTLPQSNGPESKIERLREYIAAYSNNTAPMGEMRDMKVKQFASSRQKSLPVYLETLSEEDEGRSRMSGVDPYDKEARLRMFISDAMSSSGKSSNSENSHISSNQSESDSMSSCSERRSHSTRQRLVQQRNAYNKHMAEQQQQMENEEKLMSQNKNTQFDRTGYFSNVSAQRDEFLTAKTGKNTPKRQFNSALGKLDVKNVGPNSAHTTVKEQSLIHPNSSGKNQDKFSNTSDRKKETFQSGESKVTRKNESIHSKDSLEVADIMQNQNSRHQRHSAASQDQEDNASNQGSAKRKLLHNVEPAMVSIVLEDVDLEPGASHLSIPNDTVHLNLPLSRCSSSSLSPIPQSPVTVIEVGLDNQQDSLDTEGTGSSKETDDDTNLSVSSSLSSVEDDPRKRRGRSRSSRSNRHHRNESGGRALPLSDHQSFNQTSQDSIFGRRQSLEVPVLPELRHLLERQQAIQRSQTMQESVDDTVEHEHFERRGSKSRASFSEESPVIINDFLSGSRSPSPQPTGRPRSREGRRRTPSPHEPTKQGGKRHGKHGSLEDQTRQSKKNQHTSPSGDEMSGSHRNRSHSPSVDKQRHRHRYNPDQDIDSQAHNPIRYSNSRNSSPCREKSKSNVSVQILASNESSPVSTKSAFRYTGKGSKPASPASVTGYFSEVSETDAEEFPSSVKLNLKPRPISSIAKNLQAGTSDVEDTPKKDLQDSKPISSPTLRFCDSKSYFPYPDRKENEKVHSISRAVQVTEMSQPFSSRTQNPNYITNPAESVEVYYACDRGAQCDLTGHSFTSQNVTGLQRFHKFTQTGFPKFEISCQTNDTGLNTQIPYQGSKESQRGDHCRSKGVNTVVCLIGNEHNDEYQACVETDVVSTKRETRKSYDSVTDFQAVDETLRLIEEELNEIDNRENLRSSENWTYSELTESSVNKSSSYARKGHFKHRTGSLNYIKTTSANKTRSRSQSITIDERLPARFAPSTWQDAILSRSALDNSLLPEHKADGSSVNETENQNNTGRICVAFNSSTTEVRPSVPSSHLTAQLSEFAPDPRPIVSTSNSKHHEVILEQNPIDNRANNTLSKNGIPFFGLSKPLQSGGLQFPTPYNKGKEQSTHVVGESNKKENTDTDSVYPNVDTSKNIMVKMYELQQGLATYLSPCQGMYDLKECDSSKENSYKDKDIDRLSPAKLNTTLYDFSNENFNTTCNFPNLSKLSDNRRFSSPAISQYIPDASHSKLSRLKYRHNSHQNSYSSLDIEVDFMSARAPLGVSGSLAGDTITISPLETVEDGEALMNIAESLVESDEHPRDLMSFGHEYDHDAQRSQGDLKSHSDSDAEREFNEDASHDKEESGYVSPFSQQNTEDVASKLLLSPRVLRLQSPLSPQRSPGSLGSQRSTPEIVISPLKTFQMEFLQVPGSPGHLLEKAQYPSLSSSHTSPKTTSISSSPQDSKSALTIHIHDTADGEKSSLLTNQETMFNRVVNEDAEDETALNVSLEKISPIRKSSVADSDVQSHGSRGPSTDNFSDASMYPRLSVDSTWDSVRREENDVPIQCNQDNTRVLGDNYVEDLIFEEKDDLIDTFELPIISPLTTHPFISRNRSLQRSLSLGGNPLKTIADMESVEMASVKSLAGSDGVKDVDDMDVLVEVSRNLRLSSDSSYSEPILDVMDSLSQDSLSSVGSKQGISMNYLTPAPEADDLLQVSDYGGASPSPAQMARDTNNDYSPSHQSAQNDWLSETHESLDMEFRRENERESLYQEEVNDSEISFQEKRFDGRGDAEEGRDKFRQTCGRRGSKDNWDVVQSVLMWQSKESFDDLSKDGQRRTADLSDDLVGNSEVNIKKTENSLIQSNESSGDECDKEISRINLNQPIIRRLVKMNSDPVDKEIFCKAVRMDQLKNFSKKLNQASSIHEEIPEYIGKENLNTEIESSDPSLDASQKQSSSNSTSGFLEIFQKANLSDLQDISNQMTTIIDSNATHQNKVVEAELQEIDEVDLEKKNSDSFIYDTRDIARVLDVEFVNEELVNNKNVLQDSVDQPSTNLMDELEMIALFKKIDDFDLLELKDDGSDSSNRRCLLSQISEEETQSEDNLSDSGKRNIWQVRSRFIVKQDTQDTCLDYSAYPLSVSSQSSEGSPLGNSQDHETVTSVKVSVTSTDASDIFSQVSFEKSSDDVFVEPDITESNNSGAIIMTSSLAVFTKTESETPKVEVRAVSPRSTVHKFAQALMEDSELKDKSVFRKKAKGASEECDSGTKSSGNQVKESSSDVAGRKHLPSISIQKAEEQIDLFGNLTKRNTVSHTTRIVHNNARSHVTDKHITSNLDEDQNKHVSTATINIGDYRKKQDYDATQSLGQSSPTPHQPSRTGAHSPKTNGGMTVSRRNTIIRALKDRLSSEASLSTDLTNSSRENDSYSLSTDSMETVRQMSRDLSQEELKDKVRSLFLLGGKDNDSETVGCSSVKSIIPGETSDKPNNDTVHSKDSNSHTITSLGNTQSSDDINQGYSNRANDIQYETTECNSILHENSSTADADLKAQVKAMLLIDDGCNQTLSGQVKSQNESAIETVTTTPSKRRVKVTTMFSQNSEDSSMYFQKPSNVDDNATTETDLNVKTSLNSIRTQISPIHKRNQTLSQATVSSPNNRKLRSRDSLLKLHQQAQVFSSTGSDSDSELSSALKNQGDYDIRERDLALGRLSNDNNDEDEPVVPKEASQIFSDSENRASENSRHLYSLHDAQEHVPDLTINSPSDAHAPKVVIQQPSEDNLTKHDPLRAFLIPTLEQSQNVTQPPLSNNNDNHLHTTDLNSEQVTSFQPPIKHNASMWMHRSPRSQFLSPNAALHQKNQNDTYQYRQTFTRQADPSHPELAYLNILPRLARQEQEMKSFDTVIGGQKPKPPTVSIAVSGPSETNAIAQKNAPKEHSKGDLAELAWPDQHGVQKDNVQKESKAKDYATENEEFATDSQMHDMDASYLKSLLLPFTSDVVADESKSDSSALKRQDVLPKDVLLRVSIPKQTDSDLEQSSPNECGEILSRRASAESLEIQLSYKKSLSVTSRDSGFDSQGSPIDAVAHKITEWKAAPFSLVSEEAARLHEKEVSEEINIETKVLTPILEMEPKVIKHKES